MKRFVFSFLLMFAATASANTSPASLSSSGNSSIQTNMSCSEKSSRVVSIDDEIGKLSYGVCPGNLWYRYDCNRFTGWCGWSCWL